MPKLFSYVVQHDQGYASNPYFGLCTLCRCKFRKSATKPKNLVEKAERGDWIIGTGGANLKKSAGHGKLVYAMRVDEKLTRWQYFIDRRFRNKKQRENGTYERKRGDNIRPANRFERQEQSVLISHHFYYFGKKAKHIPQKKFPGLEKRGPKFKSDFKDVYIARFVKWLERHKPGRRGDPCMKRAEDLPKRKSSDTCKPSC